MENKDVSVKKAVREFTADVINEGDPKEPKVLIIREGDAPKQLDAIKPNKVHIVGVIDAPSKFYEKRKGEHNPLKSHVLYNIQDGTITLVVDERFENDNYKITGKLQKNTELVKFKINTGEQFEPKDLLKLLKFSRVYFDDKNENAKICLALQNFKAKVTSALEKQDDLRGEKLNNLHSKIEHDLQESFVLDIAIFKGQPKAKFKVDVCLELRAGDVYVYLESTQLKELEMTSAEGILGTELEKFKDIVCLQQ
jgi:hypothetical protein